MHIVNVQFNNYIYLYIYNFLVLILFTSLFVGIGIPIRDAIRGVMLACSMSRRNPDVFRPAPQAINGVSVSDGEPLPCDPQSVIP